MSRPHPGKKRAPPYRLEWTEEAWAELKHLRVVDRSLIIRAADSLVHDAEVETRNRKPLGEPLEDLPDATWEVRVRARYRLLYCIRPADGENEQKIVEILRAIIKDRETTGDALRRNP